MMKKVLTLLVIPLFAASCLNVSTAEADHEDEEKTDGVFLHISKGSEDAHDVLMALMLADKFSTSNDVLLFFDKQGIELMVKDAPNVEMDPFDPSDEIFQRLVDLEVEILACPACLKKAGYTEDDLREGVKIAEKEKFFDFTEGRILTLDY
jgi:predicted peroxiredoxin